MICLPGFTLFYQGKPPSTHHMMEIDEVDDARFGFAILKMLTLPPVNMGSWCQWRIPFINIICLQYVNIYISNSSYLSNSLPFQPKPTMMGERVDLNCPSPSYEFFGRSKFRKLLNTSAIRSLSREKWCQFDLNHTDLEKSPKMMNEKPSWWRWQLNHLLFSTLFGEMIQFD